jgi:hypothetical protein
MSAGAACTRADEHRPGAVAVAPVAVAPVAVAVAPVTVATR